MHSETDASLASSGNCRHWATGLGGRQAAHSRPSDRRRRTPDGQACCDDVVVRQDGGGWKIEVADDWQRPMWGGSSSRGTGEPCLEDTGELSLRAYGGFAAKHRASGARSGADVSSLGRTSQYYWRHGLRNQLLGPIPVRILVPLLPSPFPIMFYCIFLPRRNSVRKNNVSASTSTFYIRIILIAIENDAPQPSKGPILILWAHV